MKARKNIFDLGGSMYPYDIPVGTDMPATQYNLLQQNIDAKKDKDKYKMTNPFMGTPKTLFDLGGDIQMNGADYSIGKVYDVSKEEANRLKAMGYEFTVVG